ncbi:MAG: hypothetical protein KAI84_20595, partial [Gammaproteobacteria bacterium]|nr:hypothetical protein [Gammaproteobacteria bacterium]
EYIEHFEDYNLSLTKILGKITVFGWALSRMPIIILTGARQVRKSTVLKQEKILAIPWNALAFDL